MSKDSEIAIKVENLHKSFSLAHDKSTSIKAKFVKPFKRSKTDLQKVLNGVSFEIKKGEFFGIVGRNGSGKSTLLKILAGIYTPDKGMVHVSGKLVPFIELGVGFNPELSGKDNVFLNGALLGFSRKEITNMYDEIVEFAELQDHMDKKLKNYSSGMQVRLAFSIAIRAKGDILVLDEVLAVGDEAFQRKCYAYFSELKRENKTVILVTHSMESVQRFCDRAFLIEGGKITDSSTPSVVAAKYYDVIIDKNSNTDIQKKIHEGGCANAELNVTVTNQNVSLNVLITPVINMTEIAITIAINNSDGNMVYRWASDEALKKSISLNMFKKVHIKLDLENIFPDGKYNIELGIKKIDRSIVHTVFNNIAQFQIINENLEKRNSFWKPKERLRYN